MRVIGITGGVGAGKSEVLSFLEREWGAFILRSDELGHEVMEPGGSGYDAVCRLFGDSVMGEDGRLRRDRIAAIVFKDPEMLKKLEAIIHPAVKEEILRRLAMEKERGRRLAAVESALLLEQNYQAFCDEVWYIFADKEIRIKRVMETRGYTREKAEGIIAAQKSEDFYRAGSDFVIVNNGVFSEAEEQIRERLS